MRKRRGSIFSIVNTIFLSLLTLITLYPFYYILIYAFNDPVDSSRGGLRLLPRVFSVDAFRAVLSDNDILGPMRISITRTVLGAVVMIVFTMIFAYCITRRRLLFRKAILKLIVITMYVSGGVIPIYMVMKWTHLTNSYWAYIIPNLTNAFNIILFKTFIEQLPDSLDESAQIDGANDIVILTRIVTPLCMPIIATVALFTAVWHWNAWYDNYIYINNNKGLTTLQYILMMMLMEAEAMRQSAAQGSASAMRMSPEAIRMAISVIIIGPIFAVYPFIQRFFVKGIMLGAVKG